MKEINKYIQFEVSIKQIPMIPLEASTESLENNSNNEEVDEDGYKIATEEDIDLLAKILGGGV